MKKIALLLIFLQIFLSSCSFQQKVDASDFNVRYQNLENKEFEKKIEDWGNYILNQTKVEFENNQKKGIEIEQPKIYSDFREFEGEGIKSIIYRINKKVSEKEENLVRVFYLKGNKEILKNEIINISDDTKKAKLADKLAKRIKDSQIGFSDLDTLKENLNKSLSFQYFYLNGDKVVFIFEQGIAGLNSLGNIEVSVNFDDLYDFLNLEAFPEIRDKIKRKQFYETFARDKANGKYNEVTKKFNNGKKYISLTFDDGPNPKTTPELLDTLKKYNVKATFYTLGRNVEAYPKIAKRIVDEGHEIANHSWNHTSFLTLKADSIKKQIQMTDDAIKKATGKEAKLFRPPYGAQNSTTNNLVGKTIVMWDVDSMDWKNRNVTKNLSQTLAQVKNGSIILFHDIHKPSIDTIEALIKSLKEKGYDFLTTSELLEIGQGNIKGLICHNEFNCKKY